MKKISGLIMACSMALSMGASAALVWTDDGQWHGTDNDVTNWLDTVTGLYPTSGQINGTMPTFVGGVVVTNAGTCNGKFWIGDNDMVINNMGQMIYDDIQGNPGSTLSITAATLDKASVTLGVAVTLNDAGVLKLSDTATPLDDLSTVDLNSSSANLTFENETYADFIAEHVNQVTSFGAALVFGSDPVLPEPGDNAYATEVNGGLGIMITTEPTVLVGALVWTDASAFHGSTTLDNWEESATGLPPTVVDPMNYYAGGVLIATGICNGDLHIADNIVVISNMNSQMVSGEIEGNAGSTVRIIDCGTTVEKTYIGGGVAVTVDRNSTFRLTGGGNPINGSTIDFNATTAVLQLKAETWADFESEHINKVTMFGAALEFGSDPYVEEPGDNAVAADYNAPNGVAISYSDGIPPPSAIPTHEDFDGILGESVNGTGSGNGWGGNWLQFGGTADATTYAADNSFSDGSVSVLTSGLSAGLSGGEDLQRSLAQAVSLDDYPELWLSFLVDSSAGNAIGHEYRVTLASGGSDVVSFGKEVNKGWELRTSSTNLTFVNSGATVGNFLGVVKIAFDGSDTIFTGYLAKDSDTGLDILDVSTFLNTGSITNSGSAAFDAVRIKANNTATTTIDEIRIAETYLASIGLGGSPTEPIGDIVIVGTLAGGGMTLSWATTFGQIYNVETNANLIYPNWGVYGDAIIGAGGGITVTTAVDQAEMFYKVTTP